MKPKTKTCRRCGEDLSTLHFRRNGQRKDGLHSLCRLCDHKARNGEFAGDPKWREPGDPVERFWSKVDKTGDCWLWTGTVGRSGFGAFGYMKDGAAHNVLAHRFSYELHHGKLARGQHVYQDCLNKLCVHPRHIFRPAYDSRWHKYMAKKAGLQ